MSVRIKKLMGFGRFIWTLIMQPVLLHEEYIAIGIDPNLSVWKLWKKPGEDQPMRRRFLKFSLIFLFGFLPCIIFFLAWISKNVGLNIDYLKLAIFMAFSQVAVLIFSLAKGQAFALAKGLIFILTFLRIPIYLLEILWQRLLQFTPRHLALSPVLHHELSILPQPFLSKAILQAASENPSLAHKMIKACARSHRQQQIGKRALFQLQVCELEILLHQQAWQQIKDLQGRWLPGLGSDEPLLPFSKMAAFFLAADLSETDRNRLKNLQEAKETLQSLENNLRQEKGYRAQILLRETLPTWQQTLKPLLQTAEEQAAKSLTNPFFAGNPLDPKQGGEVFRGRESLVGTLEEVLSDHHNSSSLVLLGPRRSGKTSLLKMLPNKLPGVICIFYDLQASPIDTPESFFQALAREAQTQAIYHFQVKLPPLPQGPPLQALARWLELLEDLPNKERVLFCIDEFEVLERTFPDAPQELHKLMGLLRATIQHRKNVKLLISGTTTFDRLGEMWDDYFINIQELRMTWLTREETVDLLNRPVPEFPPETIPPSLAETIYTLTGGQPFLSQFLGLELVNLLNRQSRRAATEEDLEWVIGHKLFVNHGGYFRQALKPLSKEARSALTQLARGSAPQFTGPLRKELNSWLMLTSEDRAAVPLLGRWLLEQG